MMSSFTPKNKLVEVFNNVITSSSDLLSQLSSIMDQKVADSHKSASDLLINRTDELDILKKSKSIYGSYSFKTVKPSPSATLAAPQEPLYGMLTGYFA